MHPIPSVFPMNPEILRFRSFFVFRYFRQISRETRDGQTDLTLCGKQTR
jgi:hypothetical protein